MGLIYLQHFQGVGRPLRMEWESGGNYHPFPNFDQFVLQRPADNVVNLLVEAAGP